MASRTTADIATRPTVKVRLYQSPAACRFACRVAMRILTALCLIRAAGYTGVARIIASHRDRASATGSLFSSPFDPQQNLVRVPRNLVCLAMVIAAFCHSIDFNGTEFRNLLPRRTERNVYLRSQYAPLGDFELR